VFSREKESGKSTKNICRKISDSIKIQQNIVGYTHSKINHKFPDRETKANEKRYRDRKILIVSCLPYLYS
jgi:hypothetical protein